MARLEVYADIWCPFAHVGLRALARQLAERGRGDEPFYVRAWPLELVNGRPQDAAKATDHIAELQASVAPDLFGGFDPERFPSSTLPALAVAARAYRESASTGQAVSFALRDALFEERRDIEDPTVLETIAAAHGCNGADAFDEATVLADWVEGKARGVRGSPHFVCGDVEIFCPYLTIERRPDGTVDVAANVNALDEFLAATGR